MLDEQQQKKYFKKRWKLLFSHLRAFSEFGDTEELHRVRVEIKKMKALFSLVKNKSRANKFKKHFKPVQKLFEQAGKIRTAQVNLELLDHFHISNLQVEKAQINLLINASEKLYSKIAWHENKINKQLSFL